jgi:hypothetical protein
MVRLAWSMLERRGRFDVVPGVWTRSPGGAPGQTELISSEVAGTVSEQPSLNGLSPTPSLGSA